MQGTTHDPVTGVSYAFTPHGEDLTVDCWFEPGAKLPEHYHPLQEEHWSVVEGRAKVQNGDFKGVVIPEDGAQEVKPGTKHSIEILDGPGPPALRGLPRAWAAVVPRGERRCGARGPVHEGRHPAQPAAARGGRRSSSSATAARP